MSETELILIFIFSIILAIMLFFLLREVMMWYWKINIIINELKEMNNKLGTIEAAFLSSPKKFKNDVARGNKSLDE